MSLQTIADVRAQSIARSNRSISPALFFLAVLSLATLLTWQRVGVREDTAAGTKALYDRAAASLKSVVPEAKPSVLEQESALVPKELLHRWDPLIAEASMRMHVPQSWIRAVMNVESGGRTVTETGPITSPVGAMGLMQVMPGTYAEMRQQYGLGADPYNTHDNVLAGAAYLHWLKSKFGFPGMFAAYNAGPGKYQDHLAGAVLPVETQNYADRVATFLGIAKTPRDTAIAKGASVPFTGPDGAALIVDAAKVKSIRAPLPGEYANGVNAVLRVGRKNQGVHEDVILAAVLIRAHGGAV